MAIYFIVFFVALLCALTQTVTGFGYAIVMMALLPLFIPGNVAVLLCILSGTVLNIWLIWKYRKSIRLNLVLLPTAFGVLGALAGVIFGLKAAPALYMRLLGILLVVLSGWFMFFAKRIHIRAGVVSGASAGILSGVLGAMFAIGGPPLVLYYNTVTQEKEIYMASLQTSFIFMSAVSIAGRAMSGIWPADVWKYILPCVLGIVCGAVPGQLIFHKVNTERLKTFIYLFMCASGIYFAVSAQRSKLKGRVGRSVACEIALYGNLCIMKATGRNRQRVLCFMKEADYVWPARRHNGFLF